MIIARKKPIKQSTESWIPRWLNENTLWQSDVKALCVNSIQFTDYTKHIITLTAKSILTYMCRNSYTYSKPMYIYIQKIPWIHLKPSWKIFTCLEKVELISIAHYKLSEWRWVLTWLAHKFWRLSKLIFHIERECLLDWTRLRDTLSGDVHYERGHRRQLRRQ